MKKIFCLFTILFSSVFLFASPVIKGVLHIDNPSSLEGKTIRLNGEWEYYPLKTLTSNQEKIPIPYEYKVIPESGVSNMFKILRAKGEQYTYGVYRLTITGLKQNFEYAIFSRESPFTASEFYANGQLLNTYGYFSTSKEHTEAKQQPVLCNIISDNKGEIELVVRVSNYTYSKNGIIVPIVLGEAKNIQTLFTKIIGWTGFSIGILILCFLINAIGFVVDYRNINRLCFSLALASVILRLITTDFSCLSWISSSFSYNVQLKMEYSIMWMSGMSFQILYMDDKIYMKNHPYMDKVSVCIYAFLGFFITILPITIASYIEPILFVYTLLFFFYSIYRCIHAFKLKSILIGFYTIFYLIVAIGLYLNQFLSNVIVTMPITFYQVGIVLLGLISISYITAHHIVMNTKTNLILEQQQEIHDTCKRFVPVGFIKALNKDYAENVKLKESTSSEMTVMYLLLVYSQNDDTNSPENEFETLSAYITEIGNCVTRNNGFLASILGRGCMALFPNSVEDSLNAANDINNSIYKLHSERMLNKQSLVACHGGIHYGNVIIGVLGEEKRLESTVISDTVNSSCRIAMAAKMVGSTFLLSDKVFDLVKNTTNFNIKRFGNVKVKGKDSTLSLYECIGKEKEEEPVILNQESTNVSQDEIDAIVKNLWG